MRRILGGLVLSIFLVGGVGAITYGVPDGNAHPNVGLLIAKVGDAYYAVCSGTLVSPTVFLTAAHCTDAIEDLNGDTFVTFQSAPPYNVKNFLSGTAYTHPDWETNFTDIGVVVLDKAVRGITPAQVPSEGYLDDLSTQRGLDDVFFTHVGYGTQSVRPFPISLVQRYQGISSLVNLESALTGGVNLQTTANPGRGRSGICFGDSGGPAFFEDTDIVVAVHSFVLNSNCKGTAGGYRVDTATTLDFLAQFGVFPSV